MTPMPPPKFNLDAPGTIAFTAELAWQGRALNTFSLSLRSPANRRQFLDDERAYMNSFALDASVQSAVLARDWTALLHAGGHLQAVLKLAATVGEGPWHIGAHNAGVDVATLQAAVPRHVTALPTNGSK
jgi:protocatechuate 4,5-dioxygenase, alpha chain